MFLPPSFLALFTVATIALVAPHPVRAAEAAASDGVDRARAIACLATAIAYEAGFEPVEGQQAVAEVILNRVRAGRFGGSVCGVVFAGSTRRTGCQFTFTCDGSLRRRLPDHVVAGTRRIATAAIDGLNPLRVAGAQFYHANYVMPYWAPSLVRVGRIGAHIFYRSPGTNGPARALGPLVLGSEPAVDAITALPVEPAGRTVAPGVPAEPPKPFAPWGLLPPSR